MSLPRYPKYKDSGVEWLGEVPEHWAIERLSNVCRFQSGKAHEQFIDDEGPFICANSRFVSTEGASRKFCTQNFSPAKHADILMVMSDLPNGRALAKAFFVSDDAQYAVNQRVCILTTVKDNARFLYYLLDRNPLFLIHDDGVNQTHLSNSVFTKFPTQMPPFAEQTAIAAFLDGETEKIDALIAEQRRLIVLLKEKRQAVVSHAITKGLNSLAPMKPSGIEWLGKVPEHWAVASLRYFATFCTGSTPDRSVPKFWNGGIPWVKTGEINYTPITETEETISQDGLDASSCSIAPVGTILMALYGQGATRGRVAILGIPAAFNQACAAISVDDRISNEFLHAFFLFAYSFIRDVGNETTQMNMNVEFVRRVRVVVPPIREQLEIAEHVKREGHRFDELTLEAQRAIALLQERRTALISAAVTGKIDVSGLVETGAA